MSGKVAQASRWIHTPRKMPHDIVTKIGYVKRLELYKTVKPYCLNVPVFPDGKMLNIEYEYIPNMKITDIRGSESSFSLDGVGFQLVTCRTGMKYEDFESVDAIYNKYFPEAESFLRNHLNASRVVVFEHQIRRHREGMEDNPVTAFHQPLTGAHCDQTPEGMDRRIRFHLPEESDYLLQRRRQIINIWRPLKGPVRDYPLAICDARSINEDDDMQKADLIFPHYE
ncbi:hypothetical protein B0T17DRAFT_628957 [Bombardia bombarda]|uniref:Uncharacterized protein n=1 Tax=Bombardia bombarda TaxID=252184 RepID=A0AA39U459_9PEZI|nr:hypothetical protein B0T17DRAFT_628957 [Bombardia bombarda]